MARCPTCSSEAGFGHFCPSCGASLSDSEAPTRLSSSGSSSSDPRHGRFLPGTLLGDRYRIIALLGRGGMGEVYRGDDLKLGQAVALKFLPPGIEKDAARLARFHDEVRIARQVAHPNVCRVYDVGEVDGNHFLTMEYVDGEDLASLLRRIGRLPPDKGVEIARQISAGLAAAHDAGVLHRDLKPANIMIDGRGRARITDFGLAALGEEVKGDEARSGTPAYMAPEQLEGKGVTQRSDLYALGLILYEAFTGKRPYSSTSGADLLKKQTTTSPTSPSSVVGGLDPAVERIILRCLSPDPAGRPSSALAVAAALPGGDPIAAALAAGETPSPEMVAAGGDSEGLRVKTAAMLFAGIVLGMAALVPLAARSQVLLLSRLSKSPEVLAERAREILGELGYTERPADHIVAFTIDTSYLSYLNRLRPPPQWPETLARPQPAVIQFRLRESPALLVRESKGTIGDWFLDPPPLRPGMLDVTLGSDGRLVALAATPPEKLPTGAPAGEPDWAKLLSIAGFAESSLESVEPQWVPPCFSDTRKAWKAEYPTSPPTPVRLEAAGLAGKVVGFRIFAPWDRGEEAGSEPSGSDPWIVRFARAAVFVSAIVAALVVATRNLRQGRGDWRGALRCAVYLGTLRLLWMLSAHHLPSDAEVDLLMAHLAWSTYRVCMVGVLYLALEPYARKLWPRMLVSWVRLVDGRFRDPLVGRDVLVGSLFGVLLSLAGTGVTVLAARLGLPGSLPGIDIWALESMRGFRNGIAALLGVHVSSALEMFFPLMLLLILRLLSGRTWVAITGTSIIGAVVTFQSGSPVISLVGLAIGVVIFFTALFRFGLLAMVVLGTVNRLLDQLPIGIEPGAWYGATIMLPLLAILGLAIWGLRGSVGGRRWFRDAVFEAESARS
ncbi:MAG TPA: serine/threonine-protein kinase [Candidatus Polarisedimenticolia bacterium]|nr:serine/threonine-protein kinase [Candidatus Polarisedimenticolia bacterium]